MINFYLSLFIAYILGNLTFVFFAIFLFYLFNKKTKKVPHVASSNALEEEKKEDMSLQQNQFYKVGWLHVTREQHPVSKNATIGNIVKSYLSGSNNNGNNNVNEDTSMKEDSATYFAVLKFNILYLYDSELQLDCKTIINISHHTVQIYPPGLKDYEMFSKVNRIRLRKKKKLLLDGATEKDYFINTGRCVDKEDWYVVLKRASKLSISSTQFGEPTAKDLQSSLYSSTHFDQDAMNHLISTIHSDPSHFEAQWLNALLGRIFLGIYKAETTKSFFKNKILSKIAKLNARRPPFLEEITVRSVDGGHGSPYITQPRLVHLSPQGEYTGDAHLFYDGHFRVELETVLTWKYSDRLPPIRIDLVLAITLKSIEGKIMFKIKEPPTNRAWIGFYKKPKMEWIVEPLVWEKRMGYSMVSKAIQTKIEEIISETMVLPNMDDIVFFQTEGAGGIYGKEDNFGKPTKTTAFNLNGNHNKKKKSKEEEEEEKKPMTSNVSSLSYQSLPELYSTPSELVISTEPFPLLSTSISSTAITPVKKSWFKRKKSVTTAATITESVLKDDNNNTISQLDTPSQQTLKSMIVTLPTTDTKNSTQNNNKATVLKRKKSINTNNNNNNNRAQFLAANVDHSIQSLSLNTKAVAIETPTVQGSSSTPSLVANNHNHGSYDALHSVRLSKKMLLLVDHHQQQKPLLSNNRSRSKSLPSTGLSIDVAQMKNKKK